MRSRETAHKVGWLLDRSDFWNTRSTLTALAEVVADGYLTLEDKRDFRYNAYVDGPEELREWLAEWWESALLTHRTSQRIEERLQDAGQAARIVIMLRAQMTRLSASNH